MIPLAKAAADPSGHYSRPDATRLLFDKRRRRAVELLTDADPDNGAMSAPDLLDDVDVVTV